MGAENPAQLVCSRVEFDRRLQADENLRSSIAGCSSFSLRHLLNGKTTKDYGVPLFALEEDRAFAELYPSVYKATFGKNPDINDNLVLELLIEENRGYGRAGALVEYIFSQPLHIGTRPQIYVTPTLNWVDRYRNYQISELQTDLLSGIKYEEERESIQELFPTQNDKVNALMNLRTRSGVQTIYGRRREFAVFLKEAQAIPVDDCAAEFYKPVPPELVIAVIPLGEYEEQVLLSQ